MLLKLKTECGYQFTSKLESMFNDIKISRCVLGAMLVPPQASVTASGLFGPHPHASMPTGAQFTNPGASSVLVHRYEVKGVLAAPIHCHHHHIPPWTCVCVRVLQGHDG